MKTLRGITWAHTRGYAPLVATASVYADFHLEVEIVWEKRSLWSFGEEPLDELAKEYDLLIYDHPFTGTAAERGWFLPLDEHLPPEFLDGLKAQSIGPSYQSYTYNGHQWALPVDGAAQVAASRPDLLEQFNLKLPRTLDETIALARETGRVAVPLTRMGAMGVFLTLCANGGEPALRGGGDEVVSRETGERALRQIKELYAAVSPDCLNTSPVDVLTKMASGNEIVYVPFTYGYSNYARRDYAPHVIRFHNIPAAGEGGGSRGATLGGAGAGVSAYSAHRADALQYVAWIAGAECQRGLYALSGGQPAHRVAWDDETLNRVTNNFFRDTRETLDHAYLRPNYPQFHHFQSRAAEVLRDYLEGRREIGEVLGEFDHLYRALKTGLSPDV